MENYGKPFFMEIMEKQTKQQTKTNKTNKTNTNWNQTNNWKSQTNENWNKQWNEQKKFMEKNINEKCGKNIGTICKKLGILEILDEKI